MKKIYFFEGVTYGTSEYYRLRYKAIAEFKRAYLRDYRKNLSVEQRKKINETRAKKKLNEPWKYRAHKLVQLAINRGDLKSSPCIKCGNNKVMGHHDNYGRPYDVTWLCPQHHKDRHAEIEVQGIDTKPNEKEMIELFRSRPKNSMKPNCKRGHVWTEESTYINPSNGERRCKTCIKTKGLSNN